MSLSFFMFSTFEMISIPYLFVGTRRLSRVRVAPFLFTSQLVVALNGICAFWDLFTPATARLFRFLLHPRFSLFSTPVLVELISTTGGQVFFSKSNAISGTCRLFFFSVFFFGSSSFSLELVVGSTTVALRLPLFSILSFCSFVATAASLLVSIFEALDDSGKKVMLCAVSRITLPAFLLNDCSSFQQRALFLTKTVESNSSWKSEELSSSCGSCSERSIGLLLHLTLQ